jgi:hypothetical protein
MPAAPSARHYRLEAIVNDPFGIGDLRGLVRRELPRPPEHRRLEGSTMIEGQYV